jgi:hypothetical protein
MVLLELIPSTVPHDVSPTRRQPNVFEWTIDQTTASKAAASFIIGTPRPRRMARGHICHLKGGYMRLWREGGRDALDVSLLSNPFCFLEKLMSLTRPLQRRGGMFQPPSSNYRLLFSILLLNLRAGGAASRSSTIRRDHSASVEETHSMR